MKNYYLIILSLFFLTSCKKNYTCDCSTNVTSKSSSGGFFSYIIPAEKSAYSAKMTKKQAKSACEHQRNAIETDFTNAYTGNGSYVLVSGESIVTTCNIIN